MENIRDIKKHLNQEDYEFISKITGYAPAYIKACILSRRNNRLIVYAASLLRSTRKASSREYEATKEGMYNTCPSLL